MVEVPGPGNTPVTIPLAEPTVAALILLLAHTPPEVASLKVMADPAHTADGPDIAKGNALTVIVVVAIQVDTA